MLDTIIEKAGNLFMNYGAKSVSMDDIASELGVSKKTIYLHVANKKALIKEVVIDLIKKEQQLIAHLHTVSTDALEEMTNIAHHIRFMLKNMQLTFVFELRKYHNDCWLLFAEDHMNFIRKNIAANIARGKQEGLYRKEINEDVISKIYVGKTLLFSDDKLFPAKEYPREPLFKEFFEYHIYGIASPKGLKKLEEFKKNEIH